VASREVCHAETPAGAAFCPARGRRLGAAPNEPIIVEPRRTAPEPSLARSALDGRIGLLSWFAPAMLAVPLIGWLLSC